MHNSEKEKKSVGVNRLTLDRLVELGLKTKK